MDTYYINGGFVPADEAALPLNDLAVLRGYGVFDFLRTYGGKPFGLREHIFRLERSAGLIGMPFPWSPEELIEIVGQTLARNRHPESSIRIIATGGPSPDFITPLDQPRLIVMVTKVVVFPEWWYTQGVKVITIPSEPYLPDAKTLNYMSAIIALRRARAGGAVEALSVDRNGRVLEGKTTNFFAFFGGKQVTTVESILPGVTRGVILRLTEKEFETEIRDVGIEELQGAEEMFITASNKEVVPVVRMDDRPVGDGRPGPRTRRVMELFREHTRAFARGE